MSVSYKNQKLLLQGKRIEVLSVEETLRDGRDVRREVVVHPEAVAILPLLDADTLILIKNARVAVQETLWEIPAGILEKKELPIACAKRELLEETGFEAQSLTPLLEFYTTPGFCNEKIHVFLAQDLTIKEQKLDEGETIEAVATSFDAALNMIQNGTIHDNKTISAILYFYSFHR